MTTEEALHYMKITEGILLISLNDPCLNEEAHIDLDKLIEAIDMGIKALKRPAVYYVDNRGDSKEGNNGENET